MSEKLKPCPFCKGIDIRYSTKANHRVVKLQYHAAMYCNTCKTYGPRILSQNVENNEYKTKKEMKNSNTLRQAAIDAWNNRN